MFNKSVYAFIVCLLTILLSACGSGSSNDDNQNPGSNSGNTAGDLAGNWDLTTDEGSEGIDEIYWVINNDLTVTSYDYDGDSYDMGDNCYSITNGRLTHTSDTAYRLEWLSIGSDGAIPVNFSTTVFIEVSGSNLIFNVGGEMTVPPSAISVSNYTPEC